MKLKEESLAMRLRVHLLLFTVNSGLRPDEAKRIELRDIDIVEDKPGEEEILHIAVRGKRGVDYCKTMPGAVHPFKRMKEPTALNRTNSCSRKFSASCSIRSSTNSA